MDLYIYTHKKSEIIYLKFNVYNFKKTTNVLKLDYSLNVRY